MRNVREPYKKGQAMFKELISELTPEQMRQLKEFGVPHTRVSEWRHGKGLPSRRAVLALAEVTGADAMELEREVMALEIKPEDRAIFSRVLGARTAALSLAILSLGMGAMPSDANAHRGLQPMGRGSTFYTSWSVCIRRWVSRMGATRTHKTAMA